MQLHEYCHFFSLKPPTDQELECQIQKNLMRPFLEILFEHHIKVPTVMRRKIQSKQTWPLTATLLHTNTIYYCYN